MKKKRSMCVRCGAGRLVGGRTGSPTSSFLKKLICCWKPTHGGGPAPLGPRVPSDRVQHLLIPPR